MPTPKKGRAAEKPSAKNRFTPTPRSADALTGLRYDRILQIHQRLGREKHANASTLARELKVSVRTIYRDLEIMSGRFGLEMEYVAEEHTFRYTRPHDTLPLLRVDAGEALAFALAGRFFSGALGQLLRGLFQKIEPVLGGAVTLGTESLEQALSQPQARGEQEFRHFMPLLDAILQHTKTRMDYAGVKRVSKNRIVHPLHLAEIGNGWMLFAFDPAKGVVRKFVLKRIRALSPTADIFEPPADFDARQEVEKALGRFSGDTAYDVRFALDREAAFYAREEPWHGSQQLVERPDGRVELTMRVNGLVDARNLAIRWGEHVEVLSPPELREDVRQTLKAALQSYGGA